MKAALLVRPGQLVIEDLPELEPGPGEVRVMVEGVGLCGSDLSVFSGAWVAPSYPWVMGHEAFGRIDAVGDGVPETRVGETVVIEPNIACFTCRQCLRGWTSACSARQSVGMNRPGALAEQLVIPDPFAWQVDGEAEDLVCIEPTTVVLAALRRLGAPPPPQVLVVGAGAQGQLMALALLERGSAVAVHEPVAARAAFAEGLGARRVPSDDDGERFELVIDTVGSPPAAAFALSRLEVGGTIILIGLHGAPMEVSAQTLVRQQAVVRGSLTYDHPADFQAAVALVGSGEFRPGRIITDEHSLDDAQAAFDGARSAAGKTWIRVGATRENS